MSEIAGECASRFGKVKDVFAASFAVTVDGEPVVDLWGGHADAARTRPWQRDTIANVFSTTKAMTAICAHWLADRGLLDLDAPVASLWPEFAAKGKGEIPIRWLLSHQAGLAAPRERLSEETFYD
ncbi:MAG TPA: serine hydrolase domain-containing protein, partial [Myxococcota bacterium]|nr:serine hydrolase domain-containing protein [Myxococcota bacterium]